MRDPRVLVVDDEPLMRVPLGDRLRSSGYEVDAVGSGAEAIAHVEAADFDVAVLDLKLPDIDGLELLRRMKRLGSTADFIVITAYGTIETAVEAMKIGARDYLTKPFETSALLQVIERYVQVRLAAAEDAEQTPGDDCGCCGMVGASPPMRRLYRLLAAAADSGATIIVQGETGTGKELAARAIHARSPRRNGPFVALNCASIPDTLFESELFGVERGAFTGADRRRKGRLESANGGTLFLDEIGEISPLMQVKLLRVLQDRTFERIGGNEPITVDVRLIAATNRDLLADVHTGRFREDLYYRINVVHVDMPALRLRGADVLTLAKSFLRRFALENHKHIEGFTDAARTKITTHRWPGNVRELENALERAVVLSEGSHIDAPDLPFEASVVGTGPVRIPGSTMAEIERYAILSTLESVGGSTTRTADVLDISVRTVQYRLTEYGVQTPRGRRISSVEQGQ